MWIFGGHVFFGDGVSKQGPTPEDPHCPACDKRHHELKVIGTISQAFLDGTAKGGRFGGVKETYLVQCPTNKEQLVLVSNSWSGSKSGNDYELLALSELDEMQKKNLVLFESHRLRQKKEQDNNV